MVAVLRQLSDLANRAALAVKGGLTFGGKRDLYEVCGYKRQLQPSDFRSRYARNGIAARVVDAYPFATWRGGAELIEDEDPDVFTAFEETWDDLSTRLNVWPVFTRLDILAGLGRYAVLLLGLPGELDQEAPPRFRAEDLVYLTPLAEEDAVVKTLVQDSANERFGLPETYQVKRLGSVGGVARVVHASRIIHLADGVLDDRVYGSSRLERVWNWLDDLEKVTGAGAEAFWKRADQGLHFNLDPTLELDPAELDKIKGDLDEYVHGLRRTLGTVGAELQVLGSDVANFNNQVDSIITLIAGATGIPKRILVGSERGELASTQDKTNWDERVYDRRRDYAEPYVVRPFVDFLIEHAALPKPREPYQVRWPELQKLDEAARATIATQWADLNSKSGETVVTGGEIRDRILGLDKLDEVTEQKLVFNGAQVQAATGIVTAAAGGQLAEEAAAVLLELMFGLPQEDVDRIFEAGIKPPEPPPSEVPPPPVPPPDGGGEGAVPPNGEAVPPPNGGAPGARANAGKAQPR